MKYIQRFSVTGRGFFPFDMLRYDRCWPESQDDVTNLGLNEMVRVVTLKRYSSVKGELPTIARWQSFRWEVMPKPVRSVTSEAYVETRKLS